LAIASIRFRSSSRSRRLITRVGTGFLVVGITTTIHGITYIRKHVWSFVVA
jgi:hypothetical protein